MDIYHYDSITFEYLGSDVADQDPLTPENFLLPAFATAIKPPNIGSNESAVFDPAAETWSLTPDWRSTIYWLGDGTEIEITDLGVSPPADALMSKPPPPLADYQQQAYDQVRDDLYRFITVACDFPEWKQANYASRLAELADAVANGAALTTEEQAERAAILNVIAWKNALLAERDRVKLAINEAADPAGVDQAAAGLTLTQPPFAL